MKQKEKIGKVLNSDEIKVIEREGLRYFANFCNANGLRYYLGYGTLLGAIRHKGFIPWDDDIDVWMPRPDYDKLIREKVSDIRNEDWELIAENIQPKYYAEFAKLCNRHSIITPCRYNNGFFYGLSIDIFPLDTISHTQDKLQFQNDYYKKYRYYLGRIKKYYIFRNNTSITKQVIILFLYNINCLLRKNKCHELFEEWFDELRRTDYYGTCWLGSFVNDMCVYNIDWFKEGVKVEFEGDFYTAPLNYHEVLKEKYGNYMKLPPIEERTPKHNFTACLY